MRKRVFNDTRVIYYDTKKANLIAKQFSAEYWGADTDVFCCHAKFLYLTERGHWFFYENEHYPDSKCQEDYGIRNLVACDNFEALRFMVEAGRMDLAKKYGLKEEDA